MMFIIKTLSSTGTDLQCNSISFMQKGPEDPEDTHLRLTGPFKDHNNWQYYCIVKGGINNYIILAELDLCPAWSCLHWHYTILQAYRVGLYGPKIVWIFNGWFSSAFWRRNLDDIPCSADEMETAADGTFLTSFYFINPSQEPGIAGLTGTCMRG